MFLIKIDNKESRCLILLLNTSITLFLFIIPQINIRFDIPGNDIVQYPEYNFEYDKARNHSFTRYSRRYIKLPAVNSFVALEVASTRSSKSTSEI